MGLILALSALIWLVWLFLRATVTHVITVNRGVENSEYGYACHWLGFWWVLVPVTGLCMWWVSVS